MIPAVAKLTLEEIERQEPKNLRQDRIEEGFEKAGYPMDTTKWLPIGTMKDHPKSWTFMGGGVAPGESNVITYSVKVDGKLCTPDEFAPDRKQKIGWYLRDGYQACPVSVWDADGVRVTIQHFALRNEENTSTHVYSKVTLENELGYQRHTSLLINAGPGVHVPLNRTPECSGVANMSFDTVLEAGKKTDLEFLSVATGEAVDPAHPEKYSTYEEAYRRLAKKANDHIAGLAHPVKLPNQGLVDMYKSIQVRLWNYVVEENGQVEIRSNTGNPARIQTYDQIFPHDVPNFVDQFFREGDYELALQILESDSYRSTNSTDPEYFDGLNQLDAVGKFMLPYAQYLQNTGNKAYFTKELRAFLRLAAENIVHCRVYGEPEHDGLIRKGEDFENWSDDGDYLISDNWAALHGLQAYKYIMETLEDEKEAAWAREQIVSLNDAVNRALEISMKRKGTDFYMGAFDDVAFQRYIAGSFYSWVAYSGALSTFPWNAYLQGYAEGGLWKDKLDASLDWVMAQKRLRQIPEGSWGAWWGQVTYGSVYNCSAGLECLASEKYRTEALKNAEFLYENQCAPFVWSEAFEKKGEGQWCGMYMPQVSYGNYEGWGDSFTKQAILQACISVKTDGTVIIGRGIPDEWLTDGKEISWAHVNVNNGKTIDFSLKTEGKQIHLTLSGDTPEKDILLDLPLFRHVKIQADAGHVREDGVLVLPGNTKEVTVEIA